MNPNAANQLFPGLKGRAREIFLDLCVRIDRLPYGCALPSVRELRKTYGAGQGTVTTVLEYLGEYRTLERSPRRKTRLADPTVPYRNSIYEAEHMLPADPRRGTTLGMRDFMRNSWEKYVAAYNQTHSHKITIRYAATEEELLGFASNTEIDFILFHTNPLRLRLLDNTFHFVDLRPFCTQLNEKSFFRTIFMKDPLKRIWGISARSALPVILCSEKFCPDYGRNLGWDELFSEMERLSGEYPELMYPCLFNGYILFLLSCGVRMLGRDGLTLAFDFHAFSPPLQKLRYLTTRKLIPLFSDAYYNGNGKQLFSRSKIAMGQFWLSTICDPSLPPCRIMPFPLENNAKGCAWNEFFSICAHSMNYLTVWDFIEYVLTPEVQRDITSGMDFMPVRRGVLPGRMTEAQFQPFEEYLEKTEPFMEDCVFTSRMRMIMEAGLDRWFKYGGNLEDVLTDIETSCLQHARQTNDTRRKRMEK